MLHVKLLGGKKGGGGFMRTPAVLIRSWEKTIPRVLGLSRGVNKNLDCFLKCVFTERAGTDCK